MKGKQLTLQEVLNLEDGAKVWVEDICIPKDGGLSYFDKKNCTIVGDSYYDLYLFGDSKNVEFYEWIEGKSFSKLWDSIQKAVYEIEHDCYIPFPYKETIEYKLAQEICNLRGLDLTDDNIRLIIKEFS